MAIRMVKKLTRAHGRHPGSRNATCLVLGGTGLLGKALLERVKELNEEAGDLDGYSFVFASSSDADLRLGSNYTVTSIMNLSRVEAIRILCGRLDKWGGRLLSLIFNFIPFYALSAAEAGSRRWVFFRSTSQAPSSTSQPKLEDFMTTCATMWAASSHQLLPFRL
ncbi:hypothetical protein ACSSS7_002193 [Eimeria intestinalis]